ncbi:MAG: SGNH/GDSL hydrolase family protein [Opitutaceae bacterium]|nr:SGNH/GDSL hydrolase family protein [Opitutaceae bacterium]
MNPWLRRLLLPLLVLSFATGLVAQPKLRDLRVAPVANQPAQLRLTYGPTTPGWIYVPQVSSDLTTWAPLTDFTQDPSGNACTITDLGANGARRFYRVATTSPAQFIPPDLNQFRNPNPRRVFYLDARTGNDSLDGHSPQTAWRTLFKVHSAGLTAGDVVRLARGSVWRRESLFLDAGAQGTAAEPIVIEAYGTGEPPTIADPGAHWDATRDFAGVAFGQNGTATVPSRYIHLLDIRVQDTKETGIVMADGTSNLVVAGCEIVRCGAGISVRGAHQRILGNSIHDGIMALDTGNPDFDRGAGGIGFVGEDLELAWNRMVNCIARSKSFGTDGGSFEFFGQKVTAADPGGWKYVSNDIRIHHNYSENSDVFMECAGKVTNLLVAYNVHVNSPNRAVEFHLDDLPYAETGTYDVRFENNTFVPGPGYDAGATFLFLGAKYGTFMPGNSVVIRNNILSTGGWLVYDPAAAGAGLVHDHNLIRFTGAGEFGPANSRWVQAAHETVADPKFVDETVLDFRLAAGSPAIGAAVPASSPTDFVGTAVPSGGAPDLGAYEYAGDTPFAQSQLAAGHQARLQRLFAKGRAGTPVTFAVIGGSITQGAGASAAANRWANRVQAWWKQAFPASACTLVNAGIGATGSDYGALRLRGSVLSQNPDLVIVEFAVNDSWSGVAGTYGYTLGETYEGLLRQALNHANKPAVLLLFMSQCNFNTGYAAYRGGKSWQAPLGAHYGLPMTSFEDGIVPEIEAHRLACADVTTDGTHPNDIGHAFAAQFIERRSSRAQRLPPAPPGSRAPPRPRLRVTLADGRGQTLTPVTSSGWTLKTAGSGVDAGYESATPGSTIEFDLRGDRLLFSFWCINDKALKAGVGRGVSRWMAEQPTYDAGSMPPGAASARWCVSARPTRWRRTG